jgi:hypothetical protein
MAIAGLGALFAARWWKWGCRSGWPSWSPRRLALLAAVLGLGSLRVKGLYLAVVTFVFALAAQQYFFSLPILSGASTDGANLPFVPGKLFSLSFPGQRTYYYVVLVILAVVLLVASRFRDSGSGPVHHGGARQRECRLRLHGATGVGEDPGLLHCRRAGRIGRRAARRRLRQCRVLGDRELLPGRRLSGPGGHGGHRWDGLGHRGGHRGDLGHRHSRPGSEQRGARAAHSSIGLLAILLYFPRGLNQISYDVRDAVLAWADRRFGKDAPARKRGRRRWRSDRSPSTERAAPTLAVSDLRVAFGGNTP